MHARLHSHPEVTFNQRTFSLGIETECRVPRSQCTCQVEEECVRVLPYAELWVWQISLTQASGP
jgi:hypothetical protein